MLKVHEVFESIQGESSSAGYPTTFVRLYGCNVTCTFCDQLQHKGHFHEETVDSILSEVDSYHHDHVCITGGEPLIQKEAYELAEVLSNNGYDVSIETNGCVPLKVVEGRQFRYVMDVKCPSSGVNEFNVGDNMKILHGGDEVKFVMGDKKDYEFAKEYLQKFSPAFHHDNAPNIIFSPITKENGEPVGNIRMLPTWIVSDGLEDVRIQVQLHKLLMVK